MRSGSRGDEESGGTGRHGPVSWRGAWRIVETRFDPDYRAYAESIFSQANGYLGIRGDVEEMGAPGKSHPAAFVAGVYDRAPRVPDELVILPLWYRFAIRLAGRGLSRRSHRLAAYRRTLSMRDGVLTREVAVEADDGKRTRMRFIRFPSVSNRHLSVQRVDITPLNWTGEVSIRPYFDATACNRSGWLYDVLGRRAVGRGAFCVEVRTRRSRIWVAMASACEASRQAGWRSYRRGESMGAVCTRRLATGETLSVTRYTAIVSSHEAQARHLADCSVRLAQQAKSTGFKRLMADHRAVWRARWQRADVALEGDPVRQNALRFCMFQLMQAAPVEDDRISIGAKGLTGEWYRGHFFWDTEMFMLPFFIYTDPAVARNLVMYRWRTLTGARDNARQNGYRGAMYAWEAALDGREQTPKWIYPPEGGPRVRVWTGEREHHITADVAFGAWHYSAATGDDQFRLGAGAEILIETARFWASRVRRSLSGRSYEIKAVIGPDEYHEKVDNNAFTNWLAAWNLGAAAGLAGELRRRYRKRWQALRASLDLKPEEPRRWREMADGMRKPVSRDGVIEQHQGFFKLAELPRELLERQGPLARSISLERINRSQVLKQADVLMLLSLFPGVASPEATRQNWDYYEPRTTHDSSLSASVHAVVAADLGIMDKVVRYFDWACQLDLSNRQGNTWQGLHAAALGGAWLAAVRGLGGLRIGQDGVLRLAPRLPSTCKGIRFSVSYRGGTLTVEASRRTVRLQYAHTEGRTAHVMIYGKRRSIAAGDLRRFPAPGRRG